METENLNEKTPPYFKVVIGTNNYIQAKDREVAKQRALEGFVRLFPENLRQNWFIISIEETDFIIPDDEMDIEEADISQDS